MIDFVVDTWVLATCHESNSDDSLDAIGLLHALLNSHRIVLDLEGDIEREYKPYIWMGGKGGIVSTWWRKMMRRGDKFYYLSNTVPSHHKSHLRDKLGFDSSDLKFVGVASRTTSGYLIAEESDYSQPVRDYIAADLNVTVLGLAECCKIALE